MKVGPLRLNISKSGLGVSAGVRGARVSVGPRGTYVTLSGGGFQYRAKIGDSRPQAAPRPLQLPESQQPELDQAGFITTASAAALRSSSLDQSLADLEQKMRAPNLSVGYWVLVGTVGLYLLAMSPAMGVGVLMVGAILGIPFTSWEKERRTARIFYDVDDEEVVLRLALANSVGEGLSEPSTLWHIYHSVGTSDLKRNAGANTLIRRTHIAAKRGFLRGIESNVEPFCVPVGPQKLLFLPDRMLVWDGSHLAGISYEQITATAEASSFVEDESVPSDAKQIDTTWRYVNKSGGPDRRFNDNRQLPILEYGSIELKTTSGLRVLLQTSTPKSALTVCRALEVLQKRAQGGVIRPMVGLPASLPVARLLPSSQMPTSVSEQALSKDSVTAALVLLRYIAAADCRISTDEIEVARVAFGEVSDDTLSAASFEKLFKSLGSNDADATGAITHLSTIAPHRSDWLLDKLAALAGCDGKVTPKEKKRIERVRSELHRESAQQAHPGPTRQV